MKKISVSMTSREMLLGGCCLAAQFLVMPYLISLVNLLFGSPLKAAGLNFTFFLLSFLWILAAFPRFLLENARRALKAPLPTLAAALAGFAAYWLMTRLMSVLIAVFIPGFSNVNDAAIGSMTRENFLLMAVGTVLMVPVTEEVLYRGLIFRGLYQKNPLLGYALATAAFCAIHVISYIGMYPPVQLAVCFLQYIPAGICLSWAYAKADSIFAPVLIHMTINLIGILTMR